VCHPYRHLRCLHLVLLLHRCLHQVNRLLRFFLPHLCFRRGLALLLICHHFILRLAHRLRLFPHQSRQDHRCRHRLRCLRLSRVLGFAKSLLIRHKRVCRSLSTTIVTRNHGGETLESLENRLTLRNAG
jgi:hypothetical protein